MEEEPKWVTTRALHPDHIGCNCPFSESQSGADPFAKNPHPWTSRRPRNELFTIPEMVSHKHPYYRISCN